MPNRIIKESIRTSKTVNLMTDFQFRLWIYLITYVDDYGRGSADPELLKCFVFPRRKGVTESTIEKALQDLANSGSILLYEVDGESYFCFPNWADHQRVQTKKSKFPAPDDGALMKPTVNHGESPPESNPNPNPNTNPNPESESKPAHVREDVFNHFANGHIALAEALEEFEKMRKQIKKPLTDRAKEGICKRLISLSGGSKDTMAQILDQSTLHCWQDVYALKEDSQMVKKSGNTNPFLDMLGGNG